MIRALPILEQYFQNCVVIKGVRGHWYWVELKTNWKPHWRIFTSIKDKSWTVTSGSLPAWAVQNEISLSEPSVKKLATFCWNSLVLYAAPFNYFNAFECSIQEIVNYKSNQNKGDFGYHRFGSEKIEGEGNKVNREWLCAVCRKMVPAPNL